VRSAESGSSGRQVGDNRTLPIARGRGRSQCGAGTPPQPKHAHVEILDRQEEALGGELAHRVCRGRLTGVVLLSEAATIRTVNQAGAREDEAVHGRGTCSTCEVLRAEIVERAPARESRHGRTPRSGPRQRRRAPRLPRRPDRQTFRTMLAVYTPCAVALGCRVTPPASRRTPNRPVH